MSLSPQQAAQALRDVETIRERSSRLYRYQRSAPMLYLWGAIWFIGFGLTDLAPRLANWCWLILDITGIAGCIILGRRNKRAADGAQSWRWLGTMVAVVAFYCLVLVIMPPATGQQSAALILLLVALFYTLAGLWVGARYAATGAVIAALTLFAYFVLPEHFFIWMAVIGSSALFLAGYWMRQV